MEIEKLEIGKHYTKKTAYSGQTWFEEKCISKDKDSAKFERISCLDENPYRGGAGIGMVFEYNRIECERYII